MRNSVRKFSIAILLMIFILPASGCWLDSSRDKSEVESKINDSIAKLEPVAKALQDILPVIESLGKSVKEAEPLIKSLEDTTGLRMSEKLATRADNILTTISKKLETGGKVVTSASPLIGPNAAIVGTGMGALAGLLGLLGSFFERRKRKQSDMAVKDLSSAVNKVPGVGEAIKSAAHVGASSAAIIEAAYRSQS